jgi:deoxyhypusine synthase
MSHDFVIRRRPQFFYMSKGPISQFIEHHYRHFNAAALMDAAKGYETHLNEGGKMMVTLAGAMSTAELGLSLAEMIRQDKVAIISCTGANLEEDIMNLVAHSHYKRVPHYRDLSPKTCLKITTTALQTPAFLKKKHSAACNSIFIKFGKMRTIKANAIFRMNTCTKCS